MKKDISLEQLFPVMTEVLDSGKEFSFCPSGTSMLPLLRSKKDKVTLIKPKSDPQKYDVVLYRRSDGSFVLHRMVGKDQNGFVMCGDNQTLKEHFIKPEQVIAVMTAFQRGKKQVQCTDFPYQLYSRVWVSSLPIRHVYRKLRSAAGKVKRKVLGSAKR